VDLTKTSDARFNPIDRRGRGGTVVRCPEHAQHTHTAATGSTRHRKHTVRCAGRPCVSPSGAEGTTERLCPCLSGRWQPWVSREGSLS
jgi:hypothetical protein